MTHITMVGIGAGVAAALLFLAPIGGTALAFPLFALTGLPIAIAGLGWGILAGLIAAGAGAVTVLVLAHWVGAAVFVLLFGAPLAWLVRLATLSRPSDGGGREDRREWYPLGQILLSAAVAVAVGLVIIGVIVGFDPTSLAREMTTVLVDWLAGADATSAPPTAAEIEPFVRLNVALLPFTAAILALAMVVVDLWLAALVTRASGRLARPRDKVWTVTLPNHVVVGFAVAALLALVPGGIGHASAVFAAALGGAAALVGLAVLHALTVGIAGRGVLLGITYVLVFFSGLPLVPLAVVGLGESFFHLRARRPGDAPPR